MAILTNSQLTAYKHSLRNDPDAKAEIRAAALSKAAWTAAMQAIEDDFHARKVAVKALVDTAAGITLSNTLAKKMYKAWMEEKWQTE